MKKTSKIGILALVLIAVVLVAGCTGGAPKEGAAPSASGDLTETPDTGVLTDLAAAIASGVGYRCDVTVEDLEYGTVSSMTSWVKGENMRIEYSDNEGNMFYQIIKDNIAWWWNPVDKTGMKIELPEEEEVEEPEGFSGYTTESLDDQYKGSWNCQPSSVDSSKFNVPTDVEFIDLSELMEQMMQDLPDMEQYQ
jgi:hypothetical protein